MDRAFEAGIRDAEPTVVAFVAMRGPFSQVRTAFVRLYGWIEQAGYTPSGPPIGVYYNGPGEVPEEELRWELRSPVTGAVDAVEESGPDDPGPGIKKLSSSLVACTLHRGPFEGLGRVYAALSEWVDRQGYEVVGPVEEVYYTDPNQVRPEELVTEVRFPVGRRE
jgi:effector-binding domain-containing protein